jgi:hypothetical protein
MQLFAIVLSLLGMIFVVAILFGFMVLHRSVTECTKVLRGLEKKLTSLETRVSAQERDVQELKRSLQSAAENPVLNAALGLMDARQKGLVGTVASVAQRFFAAYFKQRRTPAALPAKRQENI